MYTKSTYTKLRDGSWGLRVQGTATPGQAVVAVKRSGETKVETVARVLWTDGSVSLCSIAASRTRGPGRA